MAIDLVGRGIEIVVYGCVQIRDGCAPISILQKLGLDHGEKKCSELPIFWILVKKTLLELAKEYKCRVAMYLNMTRMHYDRSQYVTTPCREPETLEIQNFRCRGLRYHICKSFMMMLCLPLC